MPDLKWLDSFSGQTINELLALEGESSDRFTRFGIRGGLK